MPADQPATPKPKHRWLYPTPGRLLVVLLAVEAVLLLSERWFPKGWAVLTAIASVGLFLLLMLLWFILSLVFRWHFQFSIRWLLVLAIAVAIPSSWLAVEMKWAKEQREAIDALIKLGGHMGYDDKFRASDQSVLLWMREQLGDNFFDKIVLVELGDSKVTDAGLERLEGLTQFQKLGLQSTKVTDVGLEHLQGLTKLHLLDLSYTEVTDVGLEHLKGLTQLQLLSLENTNVTDDGLEHLKGLTHLDWLFLDSTTVTDAGLEHLKGLTQLYGLHLNNTKVTDAGLEHLKGLTQLYALYFNRTKVTDVGLEHLKGLTQLQELDLRDTTVTDAGVAKLKKELPNCKISR